jgi:CheY-like chemotaxis protein
MTKTILVVEDNPTNLCLLRDVLHYHGYAVLVAADGREGVDMAIAHRPDLILLDLQMPVMDGYQACAALKNDPHTRHLKIIAVTSFAMKGDREQVMAAGFNDYIAKPIDIRGLPKILSQHLEQGGHNHEQ